MICAHVELTLETLEPRDVAKAMLKFWLYQSEQARAQHSAVALKIEHAGRANREATRQWQESDDFGFGPILPFSESEIRRLESQVPPLQKNLEEANAMAGYIVNYITDRAHEEKGED